MIENSPHNIRIRIYSHATTKFNKFHDKFDLQWRC